MQIESQTMESLLVEAVNNPGILSSAYSRFWSYSFGNMLLAHMQSGDGKSGPINTYKGWQALGRHVRKGEKAITLCMPVTCKSEDKESGEEKCFTRFVYKRNWFFLSQTDGADYTLPELPAFDVHKALGQLEIQLEAFSHIDGNCQGYAYGHNIAVSPIAINPIKTMLHEIAHVMLGHTTEGRMQDSEITPRDIREVEAESTAYLIISALNLPGKEESRGYIQHWLKNNKVSEQSARKIMSTANAILKAGG